MGQSVSAQRSLSSNGMVRALRDRFRFKWNPEQQSEAYIFLLPSLIGFLLFVLIPVIGSFILSLTNWNLLTPAEFVGIDNYVELFDTDPLFGRVLGNTIYYTLVIPPLQIALGFMLAVALNTGIRGLKVYRFIYFMPVVVNVVAAAMVFQFLLNRDIGVVSAWIFQLAEKMLSMDAIASSESATNFVRTYVQPPDWLNDPDWAKPGVVLFTLWKNVGFTMVIYLAGLQGVPETLYEAARVDGASARQRLRHITIPLVSSTTFFLLIIQMLGAFQLFTEPFVMTANTQGDVPPASQSLVIYMYTTAFSIRRMGKAAAIAWILFAFVFAITLIQLALQRRWVYYETD